MGFIPFGQWFGHIFGATIGNGKDNSADFLALNSSDDLFLSDDNALELS